MAIIAMVFTGAQLNLSMKGSDTNYKLGGSAQQTETATLSLNSSKSLKLPNKEKMNSWSSGGYRNACYL